MRRILIGACAMMATTAMTSPGFCSIDDGMSDDNHGGASGGVDLDKMRDIDASDKATTGAGTGQMHQAMTNTADDDPEPGADDDLAEAGQAVAAEDAVAEAPGTDADDKPADGQQEDA